VHRPDQLYASCRSVQDLSEVQPVLEFIRQHADQLVSSSRSCCNICCTHPCRCC
jgi:hypothetical protein